MNLLKVDESQLQKPQPCDLRTGAQVSHVHRTMVEAISLYSASAKAAAGEVTTLRGEVASAEKAVKALAKVTGQLPANVAAKLSQLQQRLAESVRTQDVQERIAEAKKHQLTCWLGEGSPTNASLLETDSALDKALDSVRRIFA
jgi:superfamily II RNA helicase